MLCRWFFFKQIYLFLHHARTAARLNFDPVCSIQRLPCAANLSCCKCDSELCKHFAWHVKLNKRKGKDRDRKREEIKKENEWSNRASSRNSPAEIESIFGQNLSTYFSINNPRQVSCSFTSELFGQFAELIIDLKGLKPLFRLRLSKLSTLSCLWWACVEIRDDAQSAIAIDNYRIRLAWLLIWLSLT